MEEIKINDIVKHSKNIIDLIEVGECFKVEEGQDV